MLAIAQILSEISSLFMGPSNNHELAIARLVDKIALEGSLSVSDAAQVMSSVDFVMSKDDVKFLVHYIHWRMDNPIVKS